METEVKIPLLNHGYIELIETWGSDERIIEGARQSTGKGFLGWDIPCRNCIELGRINPGDFLFKSYDHSLTALKCKSCKGTGQEGDQHLLRRLWKSRHATPFEMAGLIVEVQAPIFVVREWQRHRTQGYSEMSGRYTTLPDLCYVPSIDRILNAKQSTTNKQGSQSMGDEIGESEARRIQKTIEGAYKDARDAHDFLVSEFGLAREIASRVLPVNQFTRMRATANLRNWLAFLLLRMAPDAQWEIRQYANTLGEMIMEKFPRTWQLFMEDFNARDK